MGLEGLSITPIVVIGWGRENGIIFMPKLFNEPNPSYVMTAMIDFVETLDRYRYSRQNLGAVLHNLHPRPRALVIGIAVPPSLVDEMTEVWTEYVDSVLKKEFKENDDNRDDIGALDNDPAAEESAIDDEDWEDFTEDGKKPSTGDETFFGRVALNTSKKPGVSLITEGLCQEGRTAELPDVPSQLTSPASPNKPIIEVTRSGASPLPIKATISDIREQTPPVVNTVRRQHTPNDVADVRLYRVKVHITVVDVVPEIFKSYLGPIIDFNTRGW